MVEVREGDVLDGRYQIGPLIARGGMSSVHRATDLRLGRHVAAKVMDPRFVDDESFRVRFEREARAVARMTDESLVNVYDQGVDDAGHVFLIMELVDGGTLRELLRERGPMPPHAAAAVMRPVLRALSLAHSRSLVHRDIKPENVLISDGGKVKLADFGLVRAAADAKVTSNSVIVGTVGYLSPEQVTGADVTPASDVYSAGVLLYELLTGTTPFTGDTSLAVALQRLNKDVPPPSDAIDGVPYEFDDLVARACAREPGDRFASATEFADSLDEVVEELGLPPFRVPAPVDSAAHRASSTLDDVPAPAPEDVQGTDLLDGMNETRADAPVPLPAPGTFTSPEAGRGYDDAHDDDLDDLDRPYDDGYNVLPDDRRDPTEPEEAWSRRPDGTAILPGAAVPGMPAPAPAHRDDRYPDRGSDAAPHRRKANAREGRQRTRTGCAIWLIIALVATLGMGLGAWWLGSGRYGEVPSITGMTESQALATVGDAGFDANPTRQYHDVVPEAQVIGTEPIAGTRAVKGGPVTVLVSLGRPTVPAFPADRSASRYTTMLDERTLVAETGDPVYSETVPRGQLVMAEPAPGQVVNTGSTVVLRLSRGQAPVQVPDVVGLSLDDARTLLEDTGLTVAEVQREFDGDAAPDEVLAVTPEAGTGLARGSDITVTANNGIEVPDVSGLSVDEARERLRDAGLTVGDVTDVSDSTRPNGRVDRTEPASGDVVDPDDPRVELKVSTRVDVPNLLGSTISDARRAAEEAGLEFEVSNDSSDSDRVITQSPRPGATAARGDTVTVRGL
ncbi:PASTA domain-containing protein [uncultured Corynebacterium sp.]|uniref:PASTA domain-containing protein n=1 Tax=uncultured Corynebacterium sp. TaxID=159447 RepID=UPI00260169E0|nr:PASTA domain-containing protein [uncultured Corynebacterium sp.]